MAAMDRSSIERGLQQGDLLEIKLENGRLVYVRAVRTRPGYVRLEVEAPPGCSVRVMRKGGRWREAEREEAQGG